MNSLYLSNLYNAGRLLFLLLFITDSPQLWAQDTLAQQLRIKALANELRCPTCQGLSVKDSEAGFSVSIRNKVEAMVREGYNDDQIRAFFVERYGEWILRAPPMEGFNLVLWGLPGAGVLVGFWFVYCKSRRWVETQTQSHKEQFKSLSEEDVRQVEKDLERFRRT